MALLEKIFVKQIKNNDSYRNFKIGDRSCGKALEEVRLLLYKECERSGRKVLFDSATIEKIPANNNDKPDYGKSNKLPCILEVSEGFSYLYKGPARDAGTLGEMIFGAVAMSCKSVSLKIHIMNDPKRLMCTKVFCVPTLRRISRPERRTDGSGNSTLELSGSGSLNVSGLKDGVSMSFSIDRGDSGFYGEQSSCSALGSSVDFYTMFDEWDGNVHEEYCFTSTDRMSLSGSGSWHRRAYRSMATRFNLTPDSSTLKVPTAATVSSGDSQVYSNSSRSCTSESITSTSATTRRSKLGLALLITVDQSADMDVIRHCVEHSTQLQSLVCRLRLATLTAGSGTKFVSTLHKATNDAATWLSDLMFGNRLQPMWLTMASSEPRRADKLAESLLADLCSVINVGDTKTTNFFISTLLTHVLTYHLGWVSTVSPYDSIDTSKVLAAEGPYKPYNALWAQLGDLCGSIGRPPRSAKTIISGANNTKFVNRLLAVLTYFIRCGDVKRNNFNYEDCVQSEVVCVDKDENSNKSTSSSEDTINSSDDTLTSSNVNVNDDFVSERLKVVPSVINVSSSSINNTNCGVPKGMGLKKTSTVTNLDQTLSKTNIPVGFTSTLSKQLRRNPTMMISVNSFDSSEDLSDCDESVSDNKVVFTLGDDDKLVGLKNKSNGGKSVKKSPKITTETDNIKPPEKKETEEAAKVDCDENCNREDIENNTTKCCSQTLQHSKPIKHSGFKFEFDKYPQIVTNYMKSKNLEILDRHYIGKPGNLKLDNFQFDPTVVPPIQEERCETCYKCQMMELLLQTPTNASEMEYMNDMPRQVEPQYAKESIVEEPSKHRELSPKTFIRKRKENTVVVNMKRKADRKMEHNNNNNGEDKCEVRRVIELPCPNISLKPTMQVQSGYDASLLGGISDHYVPDLILQGTLSTPIAWEADLRRDLDLTCYLNKTLETPTQAIAIIGDVNSWEVRIVGRDCGGGGLSPRVGGMLDALPAMRSAKVPAYECLLFLESKLRELCVLSMTLADLLMSGELCDITTLTTSLQVDINDVPLLLAVATTHTPQLAARYGITYT